MPITVNRENTPLSLSPKLPSQDVHVHVYFHSLPHPTPKRPHYNPTNDETPSTDSSPSDQQNMNSIQQIDSRSTQPPKPKSDRSTTMSSSVANGANRCASRGTKTDGSAVFDRCDGTLCCRALEVAG